MISLTFVKDCHSVSIELNRRLVVKFHVRQQLTTAYKELSPGVKDLSEVLREGKARTPVTGNITAVRKLNGFDHHVTYDEIETYFKI